MDILTSIEPQLAIPVLAVVGFAILVFIFGFQKTQEPSYQHLAVLQSSGKSNKSKQKPVNSTAGSGTKGSLPKPKDKTLANGHAHAVQGKEKVANGSAKSEKVVNKENVTPKVKNAKKAEPKPAEDLEGGDWIQAVSRKDKKTKPKKEETGLPPKSSKVQRIEDVISSMNKAKQLAETNTNGDAGNVLKEVNTIQAKEEETKTSSVESTPKKAKGKAKKTAAVETKVVEQPKEVEKVEEVKPIVEEPVKEVAPTKAKGKGKIAPEPVSEFANNVAFDELGGADAWEEAKSRGAKKKRVRKD